MSKQAIIDKIIAGAKLTARSLESESEEKVSQDLKILSEQLEGYSERQREAAGREAEAIVLRRKKVAELDAQKFVLQSKRGIVDEVFDAAVKELSALPDAKYAAFISSMLKEFASNGDTVVVSEKDKKRITKELLDKAAASKKIKLTLSKEFGDFEGGFILKNDAFDRNVTLESIIAAEKEGLEAEVVKILGI